MLVEAASVTLLPVAVSAPLADAISLGVVIDRFNAIELVDLSVNE